VGIGPIPVQKLLVLDWTVLRLTGSGLVQSWTGEIIGCRRRLTLAQFGPNSILLGYVGLHPMFAAVGTSRPATGYSFQSRNRT